MARNELPPRRICVTTTVAWSSPAGPDQKLIVTYGLHMNKVKEAFCAGFRAGTDICALANDACILFSRLLQYGDTLEELIRSMGENRQEGEKSGPPASLIGAIARKALEIEKG
jgi:hypothetical protein